MAISTDSLLNTRLLGKGTFAQNPGTQLCQSQEQKSGWPEFFWLPRLRGRFPRETLVPCFRQDQVQCVLFRRV